MARLVGVDGKSQIPPVTNFGHFKNQIKSSISGCVTDLLQELLTLYSVTDSDRFSDVDCHLGL